MDNVIAAMEAGHRHLTTQKSFYVEISRVRDRAELVTDDAGKLKAHLEQATGERISALEGIGATKSIEKDIIPEAIRTGERILVRESGSGTAPVPDEEILRQESVDPALASL